MSDLQALLERVEKAEGPDREIDVALFFAFVPSDDHSLRVLSGFYSDVHDVQIGVGGVSYRLGTGGSGGSFPLPNYTASIDAAVGLVEKMLPESETCRLLDVEVSVKIGVSLSGHKSAARIAFYDEPFDPDSDEIVPMRDFAAGAATPALALLAALLRALIAKGDPQK